MKQDNYDSKEKVYEFINKHAIAILSTVSSDNTPSAAVVYVIPDKELNLYFLTESDTEKSRNIESNNKAAITLIDQANLIEIQTKGTITETEDPQYFMKLAKENAEEVAGFHWPPPLSKLATEGFHIVYKFTPTWLRVADFSEAGGGSSKPGTTLFHQII